MFVVNFFDVFGIFNLRKFELFIFYNVIVIFDNKGRFMLLFVVFGVFLDYVYIGCWGFLMGIFLFLRGFRILD